ncbi:MAG: two-component system response regulator [Caldimonas sp.]|nr:MAG: two-component system response regulator [Caldimonas sp.]
MNDAWPARVLVVGREGKDWAELAQWLAPEFCVVQTWDEDTAPAMILIDALHQPSKLASRMQVLRADPVCRAAPVLVMAEPVEEQTLQSWLRLGVSDVLTPPWSQARLRARLKPYAQLHQVSVLLRQGQQHFEDALRQRVHTVALERDALLWTLALLAERRDHETARHRLRMQGYVRVLGQGWRRLSGRWAELDDERLDLMARASALHDLGKLEIPVHLLRKPGRLTPEEFAIVKTHTLRGHAALARAQAQLDEPCPLLSMAQEIALTHQERWDGSGYPQGLAGEAIPLSGRIVALATVYDALISVRSYKEALPHDTAVAVIGGCRGTHFDPLLVEAFEREQEAIREVAARYADDAQEMQRWIDEAGHASGPADSASKDVPA